MMWFIMVDPTLRVNPHHIHHRLQAVFLASKETAVGLGRANIPSADSPTFFKDKIVG